MSLTAGPVPAPPSPHATPLRIVLTGFMGAGKSTVGRLLAAALRWEFADLDDAIAQAAGYPVPEIFHRQGEPVLRRLESQALARLLGRTRVVIALGGGAPETLTNRLLLEQTPATVTVALHAPFPVLYDRCMLQALQAGATARPNLADPEEAERRFHRRAVLYTRLAHHMVDVSTLDPHAVVAALLPRLGPAATAELAHADSKTQEPAICIQQPI